MADKPGGAANASTSDTAPAPSMITPTITYVACKTHIEEMMVNFCKTCKLFVCPVCLDEKHESHICSSAKKQLMLMEPEVESHIEKLKGIAVKQNVALQAVKVSRDQQAKNLTDGLKERENKEHEVIAKLDVQKEDLIARVEQFFDKKKLEIKQILTDSKLKLQRAQDELIATLNTTAANMASRCTQLESIIRKSEQIRAAECLSQTDLYQVLPEIQQQVVLQVEQIPPPFDASEPLPFIDIEKAEHQSLLLIEEPDTLQGCLAKVKPVPETDQGAVYIRKSLLGFNCQMLKPVKACRKEDLVPVSASSAEHLLDLLGESVALRREDQGNGKTVLRLAQAGPVSHVLATVNERSDMCCHATHYACLPINTLVNKAVEQALGFSITKAQEHKIKGGFSGPPVQMTTVGEWFQSSKAGILEVWK